MDFPNDADGDVLRRLQETGFDFAVATDIDFNVDFETWPPSGDAIESLYLSYNSIEIYKPEDEYEGYILITINEFLTYNFVVETQQKITKIVSRFGGVCESWGVLH